MGWNSFIYSDLGVENADVAKFKKSITKYFAGLAVPQTPVFRQDRLELFCQQLNQSTKIVEPPDYLVGFPHHEGFVKASIFKKMANFLVLFAEAAPIEGLEFEGQTVTSWPATRNYENSVYGLATALSEFKGAVILREDNKEFIIKERVFLSQHSFNGVCELMQDFYLSGNDNKSNVIDVRRLSVRRYKFFSILLEQIVYRTNPGPM